MLTELSWDLTTPAGRWRFGSFVVAGFTLRRFHEPRSTVHCTDGIWRRYPESLSWRASEFLRHTGFQ